jgi:hypothetical protein
MNAAAMAAALGDARREGRVWRCRCPLHGGHSLVLRDGDGGRVLVTCWGGCDRLDVLAELRRRRLLDGLRGDRVADHHRQPQRHSDDCARRIAHARTVWNGATPAVGSPVVRYLASRGITMPPPTTLRWAPRCWHGEARQWFPAMVALVEHVDRGIVGVHRTFLRPDGGGKADLAKDWQKRSLGPIGGGAVRLGVPRKGEWFAIAEGIETLLSVTQACSLPGWAALSAGGMRALILPADATNVVICGDNDANFVGQAAAHDAAARLLAEGRQVRVALPPEPDTDLNDLLMASPFMSRGAQHVA